MVTESIDAHGQQVMRIDFASGRWNGLPPRSHLPLTGQLIATFRYPAEGTPVPARVVSPPAEVRLVPAP